MPSIFATGQKKVFTVDGVTFTIKKLSLEKQLTISSLYDQKKADEAVMALISTCLESWDAKDDAGNVVVLTQDAIKNLSVDVANKISTEIMAFNNLNKDQVKN